MQRLLFVVALAACGTTEDRRPATLQYVTEGVLAPACGNATCHSSFRNAADYTFDTVPAAKTSLETIVVAGDPDGSFLIDVLTREVKRMPYDQPLPRPDIEYLKRWIAEGAEGLDLQ